MVVDILYMDESNSFINSHWHCPTWINPTSMAKAETRKAEKYLVPCLDFFFIFSALGKQLTKVKILYNILCYMMKYLPCITLRVFFSTCAFVDFSCFQQAVHHIK